MNAGDPSRVLRVAGHDIGVAVYGDPDGTPVLALHGTPASRLMYRRGDGPARLHRLKLYAPDRPGYGLTPAGGTASLAARTDLNVALADALGLDRFAVLGVSGGAPYAVALASRLGARVSALSLVSPMGPVADYVSQGRPPLPRLQRRFFLKLSQRQWLLKPGAALAVSAFRRAPDLFARAFKGALGGADSRLLSDRDVRAGLIAMTQEAVRSGAGGAIADFAIYGRPWGVDFNRITAPSVVYIGTADKVVPIPVAAYLAQRIPHCRLISLPGAAHFWILQHAGDVLADLRTMLDTQVAARTNSGTGRAGGSQAP